MNIAVFGNFYQEGSLLYVEQLLKLLAETAGMHIDIERQYLGYLSTHLLHEPAIDGVISNDNFNAQLVLSIGGDGTFLSTARRVGPKEIPIMGLNSGHLGYLSAARISDVEQIAEMIVNHKYLIESRSMVNVQVEGATHFPPLVGLNEVAVLKQDTASMITVDVYIEHELLASYKSDGLIVSTPTGSTGYNLSVGGPILAPSAPNWVISPIAAHSLNMRPLVVSDDTNLELVGRSRSHTCLLSIDGRSITIPDNSHIHVRRATFVTKVAHRMGHTFIDTLREKLMWGRDSR